MGQNKATDDMVLMAFLRQNRKDEGRGKMKHEGRL